MKLSPYLSTCLAGSAFLLVSSFALRQTTSTAKNIQPRAAANGQSSGQQAIQRKHIAGVKYEDHMAGGSPGGTNAQGGSGAQRKDGSSIHADNPKSADRNSSHATESLAPSNSAKTGVNPLHEEGGKSGANPMYESGKLQKAGASGNPGSSAGTQNRKHPGRVKYGNIFLGRGNGAPGMAVNEQGSSKAPVRRRH